MSIKDYALELGVISEIILKKLKELGHKYNNENDYLDDEDIIILDNELGDLSNNNLTEELADKFEMEDRAEEAALAYNIKLDNQVKVKEKIKKKESSNKNQSQEDLNKKKKNIYKNKTKLQSNKEETASNVVIYKEGMSVSDLADELGISASEIVKKLIGMGLMISSSQAISFDDASVVVLEYNKELVKEETTDISNFEELPLTPEVVEYITEQYNKMLDGFVPEAPAQDEVETAVEEQVEVTPVEEPQKDQEAQEIPTEDGIQVVYNEEQNGIELYFQDKPTSETISLLKENKFRWNRTKKCWYKKDSEDARAFVNKLTGQTNNAPEEPSVDTQEVPEPGQYTIRRVDSVTGSEMINQLTIKEFVIEPYAQYKKSLKLKYVNNGERKERAIRFVADKIEFYSGWNSIPTVDGLELKAVFIDGYTGFENNAK